jgi:hypothetical protein
LTRESSKSLEVEYCQAKGYVFVEEVAYLFAIRKKNSTHIKGAQLFEWYTLKNDDNIFTNFIPFELSFCSTSGHVQQEAAQETEIGI